MATARDLPSALPLIEAHQPETIIIDADERFTPDPTLLNLLAAGHANRQIIFFALDSNRLVVYEWRYVGDATPADLISILRPTPQPD